MRGFILNSLEVGEAQSSRDWPDTRFTDQSRKPLKCGLERRGAGENVLKEPCSTDLLRRARGRDIGAQHVRSHRRVSVVALEVDVSGVAVDGELGLEGRCQRNPIMLERA